MCGSLVLLALFPVVQLSSAIDLYGNYSDNVTLQSSQVYNITSDVLMEQSLLVLKNVSIVFLGSYDFTVRGYTNIGCDDTNTFDSHSIGVLSSTNSIHITSDSSFHARTGWIYAKGSVSICNTQFSDLSAFQQQDTSNIHHFIVDNAEFDNMLYSLHLADSQSAVYQITDSIFNNVNMGIFQPRSGDMYFSNNLFQNIDGTAIALAFNDGVITNNTFINDIRGEANNHAIYNYGYTNITFNTITRWSYGIYQKTNNKQRPISFNNFIDNNVSVFLEKSVSVHYNNFVQNRINIESASNDDKPNCNYNWNGDIANISDAYLVSQKIDDTCDENNAYLGLITFWPYFDGALVFGELDINLPALHTLEFVNCSSFTATLAELVSNAPTSGTLEATSDPTTEPTTHPTNDPTVDPSTNPTNDPTVEPSNDPTIDPITEPTSDPTDNPTIEPSNDPTFDPITEPTSDPTADPTVGPTSDPTVEPSHDPTTNPITDPTSSPTVNPTWHRTAYVTVNSISSQEGSDDRAAFAEWVMIAAIICVLVIIVLLVLILRCCQTRKSVKTDMINLGKSVESKPVTVEMITLEATDMNTCQDVEVEEKKDTDDVLPVEMIENGKDEIDDDDEKEEITENVGNHQRMDTEELYDNDHDHRTNTTTRTAGEADDDEIEGIELEGGSLTDYQKIKDIWMECNVNNWEEYLQNFIKHEVTDDVLQVLDKKDDNWDVLIPKIGPKVKFQQLWHQRFGTKGTAGAV